jgi:phage-related holin
MAASFSRPLRRDSSCALVGAFFGLLSIFLVLKRLRVVTSIQTIVQRYIITNIVSVVCLISATVWVCHMLYRLLNEHGWLRVTIDQLVVSHYTATGFFTCVTLLRGVARYR